MKILARYKMFIGAAVILGVMVIWFILSGGGSVPASTTLLTTETVSGSTDPASRDFVATLFALRAIQLNGEIFTEPAFLALQDFSTAITPEPFGRPNPFAPLTKDILKNALPSAAGATVFGRSSAPTKRP